MSALDATHTTLRLLAGTYPFGLLFQVGTVANIVGPDATLTGVTSDGSVITILDNSSISIRGLSLDSAGSILAHCNANTTMSTVAFRDMHEIAGFEWLFVNCKVTMTSSGLKSVIESHSGGSMTIDRTVFAGLDLSIASHFVVDVQNSVMRSAVVLSGDQLNHPVSGRIAFSTFNMSSYQACGGQLSFENDIFYNSGGTAFSVAHPSTCAFDHNLAFPQDAPVGNAMLVVDPKFVDATNGDVHLMSGSPAIDFANPAATDSVDLDGVSRPQGNGRDLGAFEYH
jgi:hypothetical protein